ncbi:MAG: DUF1926 domain-containing protein [Proteobacteria bacterium]|nr:DUF1926 domain-containing protein [Pseudomonadota bacterium]MDE3207957.1 DUF1926 domain-containing protein [Pseudomonadota bacterium]
MPEPTHLLFGVHMHQPAGNFDHVMHDAHERCYRPFFETLWQYPDFKFALHVSGWLLGWLKIHYPGDVKRIKNMVRRGQVELFGGGDTEPVLAVIPYRDRLSQINALSRRLENTLGATPRGAWLTERVWEATVVPALSDCGILYTTVDDYHFLCSGLDKRVLNGYYTTEEDGRVLNLFPISQELRYKIPFSQPDEAVLAVSGLGCDRCSAAVYFDDIEKFGIWPETWEWVYKDKWLSRFIEGVLAHPDIQVSHYSTFVGLVPSRGIIYLPTTSYIEMNEWTLSKEPADHFNRLVEELRQSGRYEEDKPFVRGGIWKNFFSRYPESNWMHKRMLDLSLRLERGKYGKDHPELIELLHLSQTNDAYWHGLFGGLYLPHLRRSLFDALLKLEKKLEQLEGLPAGIESRDIDLDGHNETRLHNSRLAIWIREDTSASIHELDVYDLDHNLADTLSRKQEHYYRKMLLQKNVAHEGIVSAHDRISFKDEITPEDMVEDSFLRTSFRDSCFVSGKGAQAVLYAPGSQLKHKLKYESEQLCKYYSISDNVLRVQYEFLPIEATFSTLLNLSMPSCGGAGGRLVVQGETLGGLGGSYHLKECNSFILEDDELGGRIFFFFSEPLHIWLGPYFTVSQSEAGFEKIMQALQITLEKEIHGQCSLEIKMLFEKK